jgi:hypothetical protein
MKRVMKGSDPSRSLAPPSPTFGVGRVCEEPDCHTHLSTYNASVRCWQHAEIVFPNFRGKRLQKRAG